LSREDIPFWEEEGEARAGPLLRDHPRRLGSERGRGARTLSNQERNDDSRPRDLYLKGLREGNIVRRGISAVPRLKAGKRVDPTERSVGPRKKKGPSFSRKRRTGGKSQV